MTTKKTSPINKKAVDAATRLAQILEGVERQTAQLTIQVTALQNDVNKLKWASELRVQKLKDLFG